MLHSPKFAEESCSEHGYWVSKEGLDHTRSSEGKKRRGGKKSKGRVGGGGE